MWLASPALPVGGFSYSEGLEATVEGGQVPDEAGAARWLGDQLSLSLQRADLPLVASTHRAWQGPVTAQMILRIADLNAWALQTRETRELRQQAEQMGRLLTDWLRQRRPADPPTRRPARDDAGRTEAGADLAGGGRRGAPEPHADAGHRVGAVRGAVLAAVPVLRAPPRPPPYGVRRPKGEEKQVGRPGVCFSRAPARAPVRRTGWGYPLARKAVKTGPP